MKKLLIFWLVFTLTISISACTPKAKHGDKESGSDIVTTPSASDTTDNPDDSSDETNTDISDEGSHAKLPLAYQTVITEFQELIELRLSLTGGDNDPEYSLISPDPDLSYEWSCMFVELPLGIDSPTISSFGYVLKDINDDGSDELFIVREDNLIFAVYTLHNSTARLLGAYWPRYECYILESGALFIEGSGGASTLDYTVQTLEENGKDLVTVANFGCDLSEDTTATDVDVYYYESVNGEKTKVDEARFNELFELYRDMIVSDFQEGQLTVLCPEENSEDGSPS